MKCQKCGKEVFLPFKCPYCGGYFCPEHRLPENHECPKIELAQAPKREEMPLNTQRKREPQEYTVTYVPSEQKRKIYFSSKEVEHLTIAALLVLGIGLSIGISQPTITRIGGPIMLIAFAALVTVSFLAHELAHKFTAQKNGLWAEFRLMTMGLILTAISIISPIFKIIHPGAVAISGFAGKKSVGKTSMAGPSVNLIIAVTFIALWLVTGYPILIFATAFNAWIALFNLIPFGILDGFKIFLWNKKIWALAFTSSLALTIFTYPYL